MAVQIAPLQASPIYRNTPTTRADRVRERETFKYYLPEAPTNDPITTNAEDPNTLCAFPTSSPDTTLTALAQLTALRLKASRAMISVIAKETQYFIAEATKTLDLSDSRKSEVEGDGLWLGCANVDKSGRLCERTIEMPPVPGDFACFEVTDLSKDDRFSSLPFVTGSPYFKYYAGTPLTTKKGINIGSLFILDNKVRKSLNSEQRRFLGTVAQTIMAHLETLREALKRKNGIRMSRGLNAFVEGKSSLTVHARYRSVSSTDYDQTSEHQKRFGTRQDSKSYRNTKALSLDHNPDPELVSDGDMRDIKLRASNSSDSDVVSSVDSDHTRLDSSISDTFHKLSISRGSPTTAIEHTFVRASCLLRQSLGLEDNGGVLFLDGTVGFQGQTSSKMAQNLSVPLKANFPEAGYPKLQSMSNHNDAEGHQRHIYNTLREDGPQRGREVSADILAYSTTDVPRGTCDKSTVVDSFRPLAESTLHSLLKRYPRGKLWLFDEDGAVTSSSDDVKLTSAASRRPLDNFELRRAEAATIQAHFPGAGCFCWTTTCRRQVFSRGTELSFLKAFCNSVLAEVSRLSTLEADRQKGDFISSISHELRSPLHGILGSTEFLKETVCDAFQTSLIDTIKSCGTTLLDTISNVLDYSKVNAFEKDWRNGGKPQLSSPSNPAHGTQPSQSLLGGAPSVLNVYAMTNIAAVCEEVVEGVYQGQLYQRDVYPSDGMQSSMRAMKPIEIIMDIQKADFNFVTQPGALRRMVMNIFGNALKYTEKGTIEIKLRLESTMATPDDHETEDQVKRVIISITDTGKGISSEYLRTRLYTPFAQENGLAPGTGLGLSITHSIVMMLGGEIEIRSRLGQGTEVEITLPLIGTGVDGASPIKKDSNPQTDVQTRSNSCLSTLQTNYSAKTVALYGFREDHVRSKGILVLENYVSGWYGMKLLSPWLTSEHADIVLVEEEKLPDLLHETDQFQNLVVLSSHPSSNVFPKSNEMAGVLEYLSKPFGPYKLGKALRLCLEKADSVSTARMESKTSPAPRIFTESAVQPSDKLETAETANSPSASTPGQEATQSAVPFTSGNIVLPTQAKTQHRSPRILLVDDNKINLRLLEMFVKKRNYRDVDSAENGQLAVDAVEQHLLGYDIIFMDISMPVLNGFEATVAIRALEASRSTADIKSRALIIALTGLASARDQREALTSGVDLFMTKPTSFKEMGKLLDNWEAQAT